MNNVQDSDQVTLVNDQDEVVGAMDKFAAHRHPVQLHRAVSVWLVNSKKEVLFQKRSQWKVVGAHKWGNTICGNVWPNETYEACAHRRLQGELGIQNAEIEPLYIFQYQAYSDEQYGEHEIDQVFAGKYDGSVALNPQEVSEVIWISLAELKEVFGEWQRLHGQEMCSPAESLTFASAELAQKTPSIELQFSGGKMTIVPWTIMMLKDQRLWEKLSQM